MRLKSLFCLCALLLGACASVVDESTGTVLVNGRAYELRTRTMEGPNGTFQTTQVMVRGMPQVCKPDSPGDCEAAVRRGLSRPDRGD